MSTSGDFNRARVFEAIHLSEPISRSEIALQLDLTSAAVSNIVSDLRDRGYVIELGRRVSSRGQPAIELGVQADAACTVGLHFEHGSVAGVVSDLKGTILARRSIRFKANPTPEIVLNALIKIGSELIAQVDPARLLGVGLASVGPVDLLAGSVTRTGYTLNWDEVPLRDPLADAFGFPVYMDNNATASAIGEYWYGVGRAYRNFLYVGFFSMGLGGGLFIDKRIYRGSGLNAAEFGHMLVELQSTASGELPYLENFVSGHALCRDFGDAILDTLEDRLKQHDPALEEWLDTASRAFSQALVSVDHMLNLDTIIIGGQLPAIFFSRLLERVDSHLDDLYMHGLDRRSTVQTGQIGLDSALLGAATLPVYDAFSPDSHAVNESVRLFR